MTSGKGSISSFFPKSSAASTQSKKEELPKPSKKQDSSNMFDDQSSMDVDENSVDAKLESQEIKITTATDKKKRSIIDVDGKNSKL